MYKKAKRKIESNVKRCNNNVGCILPFGPDGTQFYAFAADKVKLSGRKLSKKERWWNVYKQFQCDTRDINSFFNVLTTKSVKSKELADVKVVNTKIVLPSLHNLYDFEWCTVSLCKIPRNYQIKAFVEALQRHLIVVIKTGAGKL